MRETVTCAPGVRPRRLYVVLAAAVLLNGVGIACAEEVKIGGTGAALGTMRVLSDAYTKQYPGAKITVLPSLGSPGGIKAVASGAITLAVSARDLKDSERDPNLVVTEYGRTPLVFATSMNGKVSGVTLDQLVDMYSGKTEQWPDGIRIRVLLRAQSGTEREMIMGLSPEMRQAKLQAEVRPGMLYTVTDQETADALERIPGAIGPVTLAQVLSEQRQIKVLKYNGNEANAAALAKGNYPLYFTMYLVTRKSDTPETHRFAEFVRSPAGRGILRQNGHYVP